MRITIIPVDKMIIVDGKCVHLEPYEPWDFDDKHIHAIQWNNGRGSLEYEDIPGERPVPNKIFGEDEFESIVQPYVDYHYTFLTKYEKKALEASLAEEQRMISLSEEIEADKQQKELEKEAYIALIDDLQAQNKMLREKDMEVANEQYRDQQKAKYDKMRADIALERERSERQKEYSNLEAMKAEEFFRAKALEMSESYQSLLDEFESEKKAFKQEKDGFLQILEAERGRIDEEMEEVLKEREENANLRERQRELSDREYMLREEELSKMKEDIQAMEELNSLKLQNEIDALNNEILENRNRGVLISQAAERLEKQHEREMLEIMRAQEDLEMGGIELEDALLEYNETISLLEQHDRARLHKDLSEQMHSINSVNTPNLRTIAEVKGTENNYSVDDILTLMDEIDPEKLYTALTSEEKSENDFPIEKAVQWFSALKDVIDKNS